MLPRLKPLFFSSEKTIKFYGIALLIIIFPLFPLLPGFIRTDGFYIDWWNHLWMTNYFGLYFEHNFDFPFVINTNNFGGVGNPSPLFYGYLFYPIFGMLSSLLNADIALRLPFFGLWLIQFIGIYKVFIQQTDNRLISLTITALCLWTIYPLTNIYNRSALTEAYATGLLTVTFCFLLLSLREEEWGRKFRYLNFSGISMTLVIGFHPITGLYGICFIALIFLMQCITWERQYSILIKDFLILFGLSLLSFMIILPWIYVIYEFAENIKISSEAHVILFPESIDYFLSRFLPFPLDLRSLVYGFKVEGGTPFLETQINVPLGIFWLWLTFSLIKLDRKYSSTVLQHNRTNIKWYRSPTFIFSILLFILTTWMSLSKIPYKLLPDIFQNIQFAYRTVFYQNLSIIFAVYVILKYFPKDIPQTNGTQFVKILPVVTAVCLAFSFLACLEKNMHGLAIIGYAKPEIPRSIVESLQLNRQNYGAYKYTVNNITQVRDKKFKDAKFNIDMSSGFGREVLPMKLNLEESQWIRTNIQAFSWNQIYVNGIPIENEQLRMVNGKVNTGKLTMNTHHLAFQLPPGEHTIRYNFNPAQFYTVLRSVSLSLLSVWIVVTILIEIYYIFHKQKSKKLYLLV